MAYGRESEEGYRYVYHNNATSPAEESRWARRSRNLTRPLSRPNRARSSTVNPSPSRLMSKLQNGLDQLRVSSLFSLRRTHPSPISRTDRAGGSSSDALIPDITPSNTTPYTDHNAHLRPEPLSIPPKRPPSSPKLDSSPEQEPVLTEYQNGSRDLLFTLRQVEDDSSMDLAESPSRRPPRQHNIIPLPTPSRYKRNTRDNGSSSLTPGSTTMSQRLSEYGEPDPQRSPQPSSAPRDENNDPDEDDERHSDCSDVDRPDSPCPLPPCWTDTHDRMICQLDVQPDMSYSRIVSILRGTFPDLRSERMNGGMIEVRLQCLDQKGERCDYWKVAMEISREEKGRRRSKDKAGMYPNPEPWRHHRQSDQHLQSHSQGHSQRQSLEQSLRGSSSGKRIVNSPTFSHRHPSSGAHTEQPLHRTSPYSKSPAEISREPSIRRIRSTPSESSCYTLSSVSLHHSQTGQYLAAPEHQQYEQRHSADGYMPTPRDQFPIRRQSRVNTVNMFSSAPLEELYLQPVAFNPAQERAKERPQFLRVETQTPSLSSSSPSLTYSPRFQREVDRRAAMDELLDLESPIIPVHLASFQTPRVQLCHSDRRAVSQSASVKYMPDDGTERHPSEVYQDRPSYRARTSTDRTRGGHVHDQPGRGRPH